MGFLFGQCNSGFVHYPDATLGCLLSGPAVIGAGGAMAKWMVVQDLMDTVTCKRRK